MPTLKELHDMSMSDTKFDEDNISNLLLELANRRQKWSNMLTEEGMKLRKLTNEVDLLYKDRLYFYKYDYEYEIKAKDDLDLHIRTDEKIQKLNIKKSIIQEKIRLIESTIKSIEILGWNIKTYIEWTKFKEGVF